MTLQLATLTKEAIKANTGMLARVCIKNGEYEAEPVLPESAAQLSKLQRYALYVVYAKASANDGAVTVTTALHSGVFDSRTQCTSIFESLKKHGWLHELHGRYALTVKGKEFIKTDDEQDSNFNNSHIGETI